MTTPHIGEDLSRLRREAAAKYDNNYAHPTDEKATADDYIADGNRVRLIDGNGGAYWVLTRDELTAMTGKPVWMLIFPVGDIEEVSLIQSGRTINFYILPC